MTGRERKPQTPKTPTLVRQKTDWQDGDYSHSGIRGEQKAYDRVPKNSAPPEPFCFPASVAKPKR